MCLCLSFHVLSLLVVHVHFVSMRQLLVICEGAVLFVMYVLVCACVPIIIRLRECGIQCVGFMCV